LKTSKKKKKICQSHQATTIIENTYLFTSQCTLQKPTSFLKHKPNNIQINVFNIHLGLLWEAITNA